MMEIVHYILWLAALSGCAVRTTLAHDMPQDPLYLEGGQLFDITWLTRVDSGPSPISIESLKEDSVKIEVLPDQLLGNSDGKGESLVITSANQERYTCVLPDTSGNELDNGALADTPTELRPDSLLQPLQHKCTKLLMGYWTYELCHGDYLRQYHEEKQEDGKIKIDEYFLGEFNDDINDDVIDNEPTTGGQKEGKEKTTDKIPVWPYGGRDYPYYSVVIGGGTPCDIKDNRPRSVFIRYICDLQAYKYGTLLRVDEATTCKYEALVSTPQLCQNRAYQLRENPLHTISCYSEGDSPRKPKALLEQELMMSNLQKSKATTATPTKQSASSKGADKDFTEDPQKWRPTSSARVQTTAFDLDEQFMRSFLSGEMCLRGGAGWWLHEVCYSQHVKQLHVEPDGDKTEVYLGYWIEPDHRAWYSKTGIRKRSKTQVVHLYKGGDICDVIGTPRQCQIKYKCVKTSKSTQISLYLEEPTTCNYILTVEGAFICTLLQHLDDYGIFDKESFEEQFAANEAEKKEFEVEQEEVIKASKMTERDELLETKRPGATPSEQPGAAPSKEQGATPSEQPGAAPSKEQGATPSEQPGATPSKQSEGSPRETDKEQQRKDSVEDEGDSETKGQRGQDKERL